MSVSLTVKDMRTVVLFIASHAMTVLTEDCIRTQIPIATAAMRLADSKSEGISANSSAE